MPNNPGLAFIWEEEKRRRRILNEPSQIALTLSQDRPTRPPTKTESYFRDKMAAKLSPFKVNHCNRRFFNFLTISKFNFDNPALFLFLIFFRQFDGI